MLSKPSTCQGCALFDIGQGFMQPSGTGSNGVLLVGEALGEQEVQAGEPFVGKAGDTLTRMMQRGGLTREAFKIANAIWCRPPKNELRGVWYMKPALDHCRPYLDTVIEEMRPKCIVTLGVTAFERVLPEVAMLPGVGLLDSKKHKGARGYVFWSEKYKTWVIPTVHPSFIMRGKTAWAQVLIHDIQRGTEVARDGYAYTTGDYTLDCTPTEAHAWVDAFEAYHRQHPDLYLSTDIETPDKSANEEELDLEDLADYVILRCGYSYRDRHGLSIPWDGPYRTVHQRLLNHGAQKVFWNGSFDIPRIYAQGVSIGGTSHDAMDAWHVLNSDLNKSLGFVTPFFYHGQSMWKHLSGVRPAYYNVVDADAAGVNMRGTVDLLRQHGMWKVYQEFVSELDPVYSHMTRAGMPVDRIRRIASSKSLIEKRNNVRQKIQEIVPESIKTLNPKSGYVRTPTDTSGLREVVFNGIEKRYCTICGVESPTKAHFKARKGQLCERCEVKFTKIHVKPKRTGNPCEGAGSIEVERNACVLGAVETRLIGEKRWAKVLPFIPSTKGIQRYQQYKKHPLIFVGRGDDRKATTDEKAIRKLIGKHNDDPFYPLVLDDREYTKLGGTYVGWWDEQYKQLVGGFPVGRDGRVHGHFRHTPSTLRSSMVSPNLQNLPRVNPKDEEAVQNLVKQMFVAPDGYTFVARDFSGIEAVLVGYHAGSRDYIRLAKIDVHSYFTAYNLNRIGVLPAIDLPQLSWSDADLGDSLAQIKKRFKVEREIGKRCIHAGNYRVGPKKLTEEYPMWFPKIKEASGVLKFYYELFPDIETWHERICEQVDKTAVTRNSFGHVHRFYQVLAWNKNPEGKWDWDYSDDAKRLIAFGPQSDAAFIGKRAMKRLYYEFYEQVGQYLRLFIHDEIFTEPPAKLADDVDAMLALVMDQPVPELRLDPSWGFGDFLSIGSEGKRGNCWATMH